MKPTRWKAVSAVLLLSALIARSALAQAPRSLLPGAPGFAPDSQPAPAIQPAAASQPASAPAGASLNELLEPVRARFKVPALAAAVVRPEGLVAAGAVGVRKAGSNEPVTLEDRFHLGSCTKAMTATLIAGLVESGDLQWDATLAEVLGDDTEHMDPAFHAVTIRELLVHRSGLPEDRRPDALFVKLRGLTGPLVEQRREMVRLVLGRPPAAQPGTAMAYSNNGYAIVGAIAERVTGRSFEDLLRERLFVPLEMHSAGFGAPGSAERNDQPCGHQSRFGLLLPVAPGPLADNPAVLAPAGTVHCSIPDWAKFVRLHLQAACGRAVDVPAGSRVPRKPETYATLRASPAGQEYAMGWLTGTRRWAAGPVLTHAGSNTLWFASVWIAPQREAALLAACNYGGEEGRKACDAAITALVAEYVK